MAGPGIRYHYMAQALSSSFDVTVGFFDPSYLPDDKLERHYSIVSIDSNNFEKDFNYQEVIIALWLNESMIKYCNENNIFLVFDIYAPVPVENLASHIFSQKKIKASTNFEFLRSISMYRLFFENGDLFLFSNRRQKDFWLGFIFGSGQIKPSEYMSRPVYDRFIYSPMGIDTGIKQTVGNPVIKGCISGIGKSDKVLLWTGGIWEHFDGLSLIKAMANLSANRPDIKLLFLGTNHPNSSIPKMLEATKTKRMAKDNGLLNKTVFFNEGWVKYNDRLDYLLEADAAISIHKDSMETEVSHRTRILDHILVGLPTISTAGDYFSDEVIKPNNLGIVVPPGDVASIEQAILDILNPGVNNKLRKNIIAIRPEFDWNVTLKPLHDYLIKDLNRLNRKPASVPTNRNLLLSGAKRIMPKYVKRIIIKALNLSN